MKLLNKVMLLSAVLGFVGIGSGAVIVNADELESSGIVQNSVEVSSQPIEFQNANSIEQVVEQIDNYYNPLLRAAPGTKWGEGSVVWDGKTGNYVTNYFWVKGSNMVSYNIVGNAQRNAVIAKYGSVNANTSYKMKTTQHVVQTAHQTQGYYTVSAQAWCYGK